MKKHPLVSCFLLLSTALASGLSAQSAAEVRFESALASNNLFRASFLQSLNLYNDGVAGYAEATLVEGDDFIGYRYEFPGAIPYGFAYAIEALSTVPPGETVNLLGTPLAFDIEGEIESAPPTTFTQVDMSAALADGSIFGHIAFGAGRFLVYTSPPFGTTRDFVEIWSSEDGHNWTSYQIPGYVRPGDLGFHGDRFMLTCSLPNNAPKILYSTDGVTWAETNMPEFNPSGITAYGDGTWVAVSGNNRLYSTDGVNWQIGNPANLININAVAWTDGLFVALGGVGGLQSSPDGITWTATTTDAIPGWITDGAFAAAANGVFFNYFPHNGLPDFGISSLAVDTANDNFFAFTSGLTLAGPAPDALQVIPMDPQPNMFTNQLYAAYGNGRYVTSGASGLYVAEAPADGFGPGSSSGNGSPWASISAANGFRDSSGAGLPGIGWIDDAGWPWVFTFGLADGEWLYFIPGGSLTQGYFAFRLSTADYMWVNPSWGWFYDYASGEWGSFE